MFSLVRCRLALYQRPESFVLPTRAIVCPRPCTVFGVFSILGLDGWCDERHECAVTFRHGACVRKFTDMEMIEIPTASRIVLSVVTKNKEHCLPVLGPNKASHTAKRVADMISGQDTRLHQKIFKSARRVLTHIGLKQWDPLMTHH